METEKKYESPFCMVIEFKSEGVIAASNGDGEGLDGGWGGGY